VFQSGKLLFDGTVAEALEHYHAVVGVTVA
jgi:hypothetical protein